ncbi:unnamed protein product [Closterium sp. NIES-53]
MSGERSADAGEVVLLLALPHVRLFNDLVALQRVSRSLYRTVRDSPCFWLRFHHLHVEPFPTSHRHVSAVLSETAAARTTEGIRPIGTRNVDSQQFAALPRYKLVEAALKVYARRSQGQLREVVLDGEDVRGDVIITVLAGCKQLEKSPPPIPPSSLESTQPAYLESAQPAALESLQPPAPDAPQSAMPEPPQVPTAAALACTPRLWQVRMAGTDCPSTDFLFIRDMLKRAAASLPAPRRLSFAPLDGASVRGSASEGLVRAGEARSSDSFPGRRLQIVSACPSALDIDFCPRCANIRAVLDCPTSVQWRQHLEQVAEDSTSIKVQATVRSLLKQQACRGCLRCIPRCIFCGSCTKHTCMPLGQIQAAQHLAAQQGSLGGSDPGGQILESSDGMGRGLEDPPLHGSSLTPAAGVSSHEDGAVNVGEREAVDLASMGWVMCGCTLCSKEQCTSRMLTCVGCNWRCCPWHIDKYAEIAVSSASFVCEICSHQDRDPIYDL